jgi:transposase
VRRFGCFTADRHELAQWLKLHHIETAAMQSTGVYWLPWYEILEQYGIQVWVVHARHTKNLPGRKSDVQECQCLLQLHTYGLRNNFFRPSEQIRSVRTYWRQRAVHGTEAGRCVPRMQKALTQRNLQLANVISDITGLTGMQILKAILAGERDPHKLAQFRDRRIRASCETIVQSLQGHWREEQLFILQQEMDSYEKRQLQIAEWDQRLPLELAQLPTQEPPVPAPELGVKPRRRKPRDNEPVFDLAGELRRITGVDLTQIDGIQVRTAQTVISEVGLDMRPWKTEAHFVSWLGLCPKNETSGGKVLDRRTRKVVHRAATAFRLAARTLLRSQTYLGSQYRRLRTRFGAPKAITAMANKLARLVYRMLRFGTDYVDQGMHYYESRFRQQEILRLHKTAQRLGLQLLEAAPSQT